MVTAIDLLKHLDDRIGAILNRLQQLERENKELTEKAADSERRCGELATQLEQFASERRQGEAERAEIRSRVEQMLARLDGLDLG